MELSILQRNALPTLEWFFDSNENRGTGRTKLAAYIAVRLALKGRTVYLYDYSVIPFSGTHHHMRVIFIDYILRLIEENFNEYDFEYNKVHMTLTCRGMKKL